MAASSRFKLPPPLLWLAVVGLMAVPAAQAQRLAYEVTNRYTRALVASGVVDVATGATTATTPTEAQVYGVFTSDGQYAVSVAAGGTLLVRHMPTGAGSLVAADFRPVLAHPRRPMLFGHTSAGAVSRLDARGVATMTQCPSGSSLPGLELSLDGSELFVACGTADLVVVDTETTAERRRVPASTRRPARNWPVATPSTSGPPRARGGCFWRCGRRRLPASSGPTVWSIPRP